MRPARLPTWTGRRFLVTGHVFGLPGHVLIRTYSRYRATRYLLARLRRRQLWTRHGFARPTRRKMQPADLHEAPAQQYALLRHRNASTRDWCELTRHVADATRCRYIWMEHLHPRPGQSSRPPRHVRSQLSRRGGGTRARANRKWRPFILTGRRPAWTARLSTRTRDHSLLTTRLAPWTRDLSLSTARRSTRIATLPPWPPTF